MFDTVHSWIEAQTDAKILADFEEERVTNWEYTPNTAEAGLGPGSWSDFDLQNGFIAQVGNAYMGIATGEGYRNYAGRMQRLQFGLCAKDAYRPGDYYLQRLRIMKRLQQEGRSSEWGQALAAYDATADFTPTTAYNLAQLVRNRHNALSGEVIIDDNALRVSSELDAACNGGDDLRRWPQERLLTQKGLQHAEKLIQRVRKYNEVFGSELY